MFTCHGSSRWGYVWYSCISGIVITRIVIPVCPPCGLSFPFCSVYHSVHFLIHQSFNKSATVLAIALEKKKKLCFMVYKMYTVSNQFNSGVVAF